jgi:integrase
MFTYMGMRREEACGLGVDDVKFTDGIAHVDIRFSEIRRIKNDSSVRFLAVHPELLRLGLMDYVEAVRALGYETLFPDLRGSGSNVPMGDRLYDELKPLIDETGAGFHPQRHFFGGWLKAKRVSIEERRDLLGHVGRSETDERYCSGTELERQLELIGKLPIVTGHLRLRPIRLLDWVIRGELPPWKRRKRGATPIE